MILRKSVGNFRQLPSSSPDYRGQSWMTTLASQIVPFWRRKNSLNKLPFTFQLLNKPVCLQSHTKVQALLDSDSLGTGVFRPDVNDPELSNAHSSTAWELALMGTRHFHPAVRLVAHHVAEGAPSKGQLSSLMRMWVYLMKKVDSSNQSSVFAQASKYIAFLNQLVAKLHAKLCSFIQISISISLKIA